MCGISRPYGRERSQQTPYFRLMHLTREIRLPTLAPEVEPDEAARRAIALLSSGGDTRITLDPLTGLNKYLSAPYPRTTLAYASSTANDLSRAAFAHVTALAADPRARDEERLEALRVRLRDAYRLPGDCEVVFAPSGTDLEYVALACVAGLAPGGIHNVLLGADEVGSGCIQSAHGRFFAEVTARGIPVTPGQCVAGLERVSLADVPVRCAEGLARTSAAVVTDIETEMALARGMSRHALIHAVHGSKTGLILPELADIDRLQAAAPGAATVVIDACQARITSEAVHDYLDREAIVFLTGSKFMGGPPFNGFALIPAAVARRARELPAGLGDVFTRGEWPSAWPGRAGLPDEDNAGLRLRFEASIFELERFQALPMSAVERVIGAFQRALRTELAERLDLPLVRPSAPGADNEEVAHPIEMRTLVTLDISRLPGARRFEDAQRVHRELALSGIRLGQPARCVRTDGHEWGGTLRVGLSMPQVVDFAALDEATLHERLAVDMRRIAVALEMLG
jgi:hypothetical protein